MHTCILMDVHDTCLYLCILMYTLMLSCEHLHVYNYTHVYLFIPCVVMSNVIHVYSGVLYIQLHTLLT